MEIGFRLKKIQYTVKHGGISNRGGIWNFRLFVVQPLYTMTRSEILLGGIIIRRSVF